MTLTHRLALAAMFAGAAAFAQTSSSTTGSAGTASKYDASHAGTSTTASGAAAEAGKTATKMSPSAILSMIHQVNQDEIRMGKSAQSRAQSDKVKDYAKDMVDDHTALDKKLTDFVQKEGKGQLHLSSSQIPAAKREEMKAMNQEAERKLSSATGATFDREYISAMFKGHDAVLSDLDAALPSLQGKDKLHDFVSDARDKVKDHRDHANDILKDLDKSTATGGSGTQGSSAMPGTSPRSTTGAPGSTGTRDTTGSTTAPSTGTTTAPSTTTPSNR
jgi:putative membrane protein